MYDNCFRQDIINCTLGIQRNVILESPSTIQIPEFEVILNQEHSLYQCPRFCSKGINRSSLGSVPLIWEEDEVEELVFEISETGIYL